MSSQLLNVSDVFQHVNDTELNDECLFKSIHYHTYWAALLSTMSSYIMFTSKPELRFYRPFNGQGHIGTGFSIVRCGTGTHRGERLCLDAKLANH